MKYLVIPLVAMSGIAHALNVADTQSAVQVYVSGSSSTQNIISALFTKNCQAGTLTTYKSKADPSNASFTTAGAGDSNDGDSFNAYSCKLNTTNDFGVFGGQNIVFHKRERDGSGYGVFPVAKHTAIEFMKIGTTCANTTLASGVTTCTATELKEPHGGVSDLEPVIFNPVINRPATFENLSQVDDSYFYSVTQLFQLGFGVALSQKLHDDLQSEQVARNLIPTGATPIVSTGLISAMFRQGFDSNIAWKAFLPLHDGVARSGINGGVAFANTNSSVVNICRHNVGSGAQAASNRYFLEVPANFQAPIYSADAGSSVPDVYVVTENNSAGRARACLQKANTVGQYAIGVLSLDSGTSGGTGWKFARINASIPGRQAIKAAEYSFVFTPTFQINSTLNINGSGTSVTTNVRTMLTAFTNAIRKPASLTALSTNAQDAVAALADTDECIAADFSFTDGATNEQKFCARGYRENSFDLPILAK